MSRFGSYDYDIADLSDFRFPGGTSASLAEEIRAQSAAGYTTALVPARSPSLKRKRGFNRRIVACAQAGMADLVTPERELNVRALIIRHPAIFSEDPELWPRINADVVVMAVNQTPDDGLRYAAQSYYDVDEVHERVERLFGPAVWAPIGPVVRRSLERNSPSLEMHPNDWHNILDADEWQVDRDGFVGNRPVIGRHSRPHWKKWPGSVDEIRAAYPTDPGFEVKILGGGEVATSLLGETPENWTLYDFNSIDPRRFLSELDFAVYFHHPELVEAFGRTIAEALASGVPTIVEHSFQELFEEACIYAEPHEVQDLVQRLYNDPIAYKERSEQGHELVRQRFGHEVHRRRMADLIGQPTKAAPRSTGRRQRTVIMFTANGEGMGHLTRSMALARRLPADVRPIFVTLSTGMKVVRDAGYFCEYIPQTGGTDGGEWNSFLERRLVEIIRRYGAEALVFDGIWPFWGMTKATAATGIRMAWIRRAMWKPATSERHFDRAGRFDLIVEPGEFAHPYDKGPTVAQRDSALCVDPILLLDDGDLLPAEEAKSELGLDPGKRAALIQLGSGNMNDVTGMAEIVAERLLKVPDLDVAYADWVISRQRAELPEGVTRINTYPLGRYLNAFDFSISAAGYNSFHELIAFSVPTVFVPAEKQVDDQPARTRYADSVGAGVNLEPFSPEGLERALERILVAEERKVISEQCRALFPGNGAQAAADAIRELVVAAPPPIAAGAGGAGSE
jgi:Glycosyl transferases group 1